MEAEFPFVFKWVRRIKRRPQSEDLRDAVGHKSQNQDLKPKSKPDRKAMQNP